MPNLKLEDRTNLSPVSAPLNQLVLPTNDIITVAEVSQCNVQGFRGKNLEDMTTSSQKMSGDRLSTSARSDSAFDVAHTSVNGVITKRQFKGGMGCKTAGQY